MFLKNKSSQSKVLFGLATLYHLVGVTGLEPTASCSQSRRATNCATPRFIELKCFPKHQSLLSLFVRPLAVPVKTFAVARFSDRCANFCSLYPPLAALRRICPKQARYQLSTCSLRNSLLLSSQNSDCCAFTACTCSVADSVCRFSTTPR